MPAWDWGKEPSILTFDMDDLITCLPETEK